MGNAKEKSRNISRKDGDSDLADAGLSLLAVLIVIVFVMGTDVLAF